MTIVPDYRGHRIEIVAVAVGDRWNAGVRIRRTLSEEKPYVETITCFKVTAELAEASGELWARRWIDLRV